MSDSHYKQNEKHRKSAEPSSLDEPLAGVQPTKVICSECGKYFNTHQQMERHRETAHHHES